MAKPELQTLTKLCYVLCGPLYGAHSAHAREARGSAGVLAYYFEAAHDEAFLRPLKQSMGFLRDPLTLRHIRFTTEYDFLRRAAVAKMEGMLQAEDILAEKSLGLSPGPGAAPVQLHGLALPWLAGLAGSLCQP